MKNRILRKICPAGQFFSPDRFFENTILLFYLDFMHNFGEYKQNNTSSMLIYRMRSFNIIPGQIILITRSTFIIDKPVNCK